MDIIYHKMSDKRERGKEKPSSGKRKMIRSNKMVSNGSADKFPLDENNIDNPVDKEEANPDGTGNKDQKLTDDYSGVQEVALDELDTSENKKEELSESTEEEEETEKKDNDLKELKKKETWNKTGLRERYPSKPLKPHDAAAGSIRSVQQFKVHDAAGGSVYKSPTLKDLQDNIKADSPSSLCRFLLIGLVVLLFGSYWFFVKQSDNKQTQFQLISCNTNLDRALEIIRNMTQQLNEMTKAMELAETSAGEKVKELKKQLDEMTKAMELAETSAKEKEKELKKQLDEMTKAKELADKSAEEKEKELKKQLDEMTKAKELVDKSLQDTENARKTTEEQLNQSKQQVQLLITQKTIAEEKIKEKEKEIAEKDEKIIALTEQCNHHHHHHKKGRGKGKCRHKHRH